MVIILYTLVNPCLSININAIIVLLVPNYRYFNELTSDVPTIFLNILEFKKRSIKRLLLLSRIGFIKHSNLTFVRIPDKNA